MNVNFADIMKDNGYSYETLAKQVNCSVGVLNKFFNKGEVIKFEIVLSVIRLFIPNKEKDFMFKYCLKSDKPNHLKSAIEYANIHSNSELVDELINICGSHQNKEVREFSSAYKLLQGRLVGSKDTSEVVYALKNKSFTSKDLQILAEILNIYDHYESSNFKLAYNSLRSVQEMIDEMKSGFLKDSYIVRFNQMKAFTTLHVNNDRLTARRIAEESINSKLGDHFNGFFYNIIATSYVGESLEKMNYYADKAIELYYNNPEAAEGLRNRYHKLNMIMSGTLTANFVKVDTDPLDSYIEGIITNDNYKLLQSLVEFNKEGSAFFSDIVANEIKRKNNDSSLLSLVDSIYCAS